MECLIARELPSISQLIFATQSFNNTNILINYRSLFIINSECIDLQCNDISIKAIVVKSSFMRSSIVGGCISLQKELYGFVFYRCLEVDSSEFYR